MRHTKYLSPQNQMPPKISKSVMLPCHAVDIRRQLQKLEGSERMKRSESSNNRGLAADRQGKTLSWAVIAALRKTNWRVNRETDQEKGKDQ